MFYYLNGILSMCSLNTAVIDCGGVGYKLTVSAMTLASVAGKEGSVVKLFTHLSVREDAVELFGFADEDELDAFRLLIGVSGIGPKAALAVLSVFTPVKLAAAISSQDTRAISRAQGIGAKTAARIVLELKDKFAVFGMNPENSGPQDSPSAGVPGHTALDEAAEVLAVLGYTRSQIAGALSGVDKSADSEEAVKQALKKLARS